MIFSAVGTDSRGRTVQGAVFTWASSDSSKLQVDEDGNATLLQPGLASIVCRAGSSQAVTQVLIRPGNRPLQSDAEWVADQNVLPIPDNTTTGVGAMFPTLLDKLIPTASAQGGGYSGTDFGFDEMWSEPRNLTGNPRNHVLAPMITGSVLPEGSNYNFAVPLIGLKGRGVGAGLSLFYNSRVWSRHGSAVTFAPVAGYPFAGFSLGFGRVLTYGATASTKYVLVEPDGTMHYLGSGSSSSPGTYQTSDGTHITYVGSATYGGALYYNDGTKITISVYNNRLVPTEIKDGNGNYVRVAYKYGAASPLAIDYVTDTKGRQIQFNYDSSGYLISINAPGYGGTAQNPVARTIAQFDYESRIINYNFSGLTTENAPSGTVQALKHVYFPGTGTGYLFSYSDYGMIHTVSNRRQMSVNGSGVISDGTQNSSIAFDYPTVGATQLTDAPAFTQQTETPGGSYSYSSSTNTSQQTKTFTVTRPDSSSLALTRSTDSLSTAKGLLTLSEVIKSSASYSKVVVAYTTDGGGNVQPLSVTNYDDAGTATKMDFSYDAYGNVTDKRDYGFQISGAWQVRRRTHFTYKTDVTYLNAYLRSLPTTIEGYDALENTNDGDDVLIAKTANMYDDYAATGGMVNRTPKPPGHDSALYTTSYTVRGNVTGVTQWTDIAGNTALPTRLKKYDRMGTLVQEQVSCCKEKNFDYVATDYWANPQTVTDGNPSSLHLTGSATYDFNTDLPKWEEYANLGKRWFYYDAALRLIRKELPVGGEETTTYNDATMTVSTAKTGMGLNTFAYDGWGRIIQQTDPNSGQINIAYDATGRIQSKTNPFQAGGTPGPLTTYAYDAMGRVTVVTLPDAQTVQTTYNGATVTVTDEVNRQIKQEIDGFGRLIKVTEQNVSSGSLNQETTYSYDQLDNLTDVNQGGQYRKFKYDALGQLLYEKIPEQTESISEQPGVLPPAWTTKYTYTDFHALATRTDARGVVATFSYDNLNRFTQVSYSVPSGVATTPAVGYSYDNNNSSPTSGLVLSAGNSNAIETYSYDSYKRISGVSRAIDSASYATSYQYDSGSLRSHIIYPSARTVNINRDTVGRLTSLTDGSSANYLSGVGYNYAGQVTGLTLGNGIVEDYDYDLNRLQLSSQTATNGATTLLSLTYNYSATAGQSGVGTIAGNSDQLMSILGSIGGQTESAAYTYDNLGRLATSSQTTNSVTAQRRFAYDRWGNRLSVYNATSGGTLIQSVNLAQSSGVPTNRFTSVAQGLSVKSYTYDAAGNVTNDGAHTYTYDAENRVVAVDGGATASYAYDHNGRRVKKTVGTTVTHYVWEGPQVIAEHDGGTGAVITDYVYSGNRMILKAAGGTTNYFLSDRLSVRVTMDASGAITGRQAHLPFGEELNVAGATDKHRMTSYERDPESGLNYAINRAYAEGIGRFNQSDPYKASGYMADPQSWNRYSYCRNNPIDRVDSSGLEDDPPTFNDPGVVQVYAGSSGGVLVDPNNSEFSSGHVNLPNHSLDNNEGPATERTKEEILLGNFNDSLANVLKTGDCANKLAPYTKAMKDTAKSQSVTARSYTSALANKKFGNETYAQYFAKYENGAITKNSWRTDPKTKKPYDFKATITLGPNFFNIPQEGQDRTLVHEMMHATLHVDDKQLANELKINVPAGTDASQAISDWFKNGCSSTPQDTPPKK